MSYSEDERQRREWLANLKVGDQVVLQQSGIGSTHYKIGTVDKISDKKRDITVNGQKFRNDGQEYRGGYRYSSGTWLYEPTEEKIEEIRISEMKRDVRWALGDIYDKRNSLSDEHFSKLEKILPVLTEIQNSLKPKG